MSIVFVSLYIILSYTHLIIQSVVAVLYHSKKRLPLMLSNAEVLVLIPSYKEKIEDSIATIDYAKASLERACVQGEIVYIEDDVQADPLLEARYSACQDIHIVSNGQNLGKRESQVNGWQWALKNIYWNSVPDFVVTVDSDTRLHADAIAALLAEMRSPHTAAVTGNITIWSKNNLLQRLISLRYFLAFNQERAAQSLFGQVLCCSGPLTMYRGDFFDRVKEEYISQRFGGRKCTFGDDRHLTNLAIREGYDTLYASKAIAYTNCPDNLGDYFKQQYRWTKSFFRESFLTLTYGRRLRLYSLWEIAIALALPSLLLVNLGWLGFHAWDRPSILLSYGAVIITMAWIRSLFGIVLDRFNNRLDYFYFPVFAIMNLAMLIPVKLRALLTLNNTAWGTR